MAGVAAIVFSCIFLCLGIAYASQIAIEGPEPKASYFWSPIGANTDIPINAPLGGAEIDYSGYKVDLNYVGKAIHEDEEVPCKVVQFPYYPVRGGVCRIIFNYKEYNYNSYMILQANTDLFDWVRTNSSCNIPSNAIKGGTMRNGNPYYVGRAKHDGRYKSVGKINSDTKQLQTFNVELIIHDSYEILVWELQSNILSATNEYVKTLFDYIPV